MSKAELTNLINMIAGLTEDQQQDVVLQFMNIVSSLNHKARNSCDNAVRSKLFNGDKPDCPHCKAQESLGYVIKKGLGRNGEQRFYCKACNKYFITTTNTVFEKTRKDYLAWEKFIKLTLEGQSLRTCAEECEVSYKTAFTWRHKILNAFKIHQNSIKMSGNIEMDEMLIPISYKGNHIKGLVGTRRIRLPGEPNNLPRKSFKRGSDNKSASAKDKACVFCMVKNGNEGFYAAVPGVGCMQSNMLDKTFKERVDRDSSLIIVDKYKPTISYLDTNSYRYVSLLSNTSDNKGEHKPEIFGDIHLQHVNSFHSHLRTFLAKYRGVSTKYLENYVSLFVWLKNAKANRQSRNIQRVSVRRAATADCYISARKLSSLPQIPACA